MSCDSSPGLSASPPPLPPSGDADRRRGDCNRITNCDADNTDYDIYVKSLKGKGSAPALVATNPGPQSLFRGCTIAAVETKSGTTHLFWASGANSSTLYHLTRGKKDKTFSAPQPLAVPDGVFNVEAVAVGNDVFVYTQECCASDATYAHRLVGAVLVDRTLVAAGQWIPQVIVDKSGTFRMVLTTGGVSTTSSPDGLHFSAPVEVVASEGSFTNWDPSIAQDDNGVFTLTYAPDHGDNANQHVAARWSSDFQTWSSGFALTQPDGWWDYWPEADLRGGKDTLYVTSERPVGAAPAGTGHIWSIAN